MRLHPGPINRGIAGFSLSELLIGTAITAVLAAALLTGISSLQRSFQASKHAAKSHVEQTRILNYIARDLRRALTANVDTYQGSQRLTITIPDYYDTSGNPRDPVINNGGIDYGDTAHPVTISYFKAGSTMYRGVNGVNTALATDVQDFVSEYTDTGKQSIGISVSFVPKYQLNGAEVSTLRSGTTAYATTLLRNKRH